MLRRILAFASLSLIALPAAALAENPILGSARSHSAFVLSQYYPVGSDKFKPAPRWQDRQEHHWIAENSNDLPPLNQAVYGYAQNRLGQQVGDGECATLVSEALNSAGAKDFSELGPTGPDADYVWGNLVATLTAGSTSTDGILVGDIIQFRDVQTDHKTVNSDGSWSESTYSYPHHTAIVSGVSGSQISLLHQNVNNIKTVQVGTLDLNDVKSGTMWVYRPIAKGT